MDLFIKEAASHSKLLSSSIVSVYTIARRKQNVLCVFLVLVFSFICLLGLALKNYFNHILQPVLEVDTFTYIAVCLAFSVVHFLYGVCEVCCA